MSTEVRIIIDALNNRGIHIVADRAFDNIHFDFSEHDKKVAEEKDRKIAELERDLNRLTNDLKQNIGKINALREENKELKSQKKHIYIVGKEIDGQNYVKFEDFMSIVEELQESLVDSK